MGTTVCTTYITKESSGIARATALSNMYCILCSQSLEWLVSEKTSEMTALQEQLAVVEDRQRMETGTLSRTLQVECSVCDCVTATVCVCVGGVSGKGRAVVVTVVKFMSYELYHNKYCKFINVCRDVCLRF